MKACLLSIALVLAIASTAAAKNAKVYIFVQDEGAEGFTVTSRTLMDSAMDLRNAIVDARFNGLAFTGTRGDARLVVQITSREEAQGKYRVHAHVRTIDGHDADLTGTSAHRWAYAAQEIATQLSAWAKAHPAK